MKGNVKYFIYKRIAVYKVKGNVVDAAHNIKLAELSIYIKIRISRYFCKGKNIKCFHLSMSKDTSHI